MNRRTFVKTTATASLAVMTGCSLKNRFNIIILNGMIFDGSGGEAFQSDIGIINGKIAAIDNLKNASADTIIDGTGLAISPGFIDIHTHTDFELLANSNAESKVMQGVTTEVSGNCGYSPFPLNESDYQAEDEDTFEKYGFHVDWKDVDGFLRRLEKQKISFNYATFTGHGNLRSCVVGKNDVQATPEQLAAMKKLLEQSIDSGSFGMSTGLEYAPGSYASTAELIELNNVVAKKNAIYATHMRDEEDNVVEAVEEALKICRETGVSLQISHLKANQPANWHKMDRILDIIHAAADSGLPVKADRYPYIAYSTGLTSFLPLWSRQGNTKDVIARMNDRNLIPDIETYIEKCGQNMGGWDRVVICSSHTDENKKWIGKSIAECIAEKKIPPAKFIRNLLTEERNRVSIVGFGMEEGNLKKVLSSPLVMVASDGSAVAPYGRLGKGQPHPRFYGTFPRVLGKYCREEKLFDLATAVKKMTSMPANKLGLTKRGLLKKNYFADIVVFNPKTVIDNATFENPHQFPTGIEHVIVNGKITVQKGKHTGAHAGAVLRHRLS